MKLTKIQRLVRDMDKSLTKNWEEYLALHNQLKEFGNRELSDQKEVDEANRILAAIQHKFANELYPGYDYITQRAQFASNAITGYCDFIDVLKKGGLKDGAESTEMRARNPQEKSKIILA